MSIHFNWEELTANSEEIEQGICDFLHNQFQAITLPPFISSLAVSSFKLGTVPPEVTFKNFSDPFPEFYSETASDDDSLDSEQKSRDSTPVSTPRETSSRDPASCESVSRESTPNIVLDDGFDDTRLNYKLTGDNAGSEMGPEPDDFDVQSYIELKYAGDMQLAITATLLVNYPTPGFISLPVSIKVTNIDIHSLIVAAFIKPRLYISILNDLESANKLKSMDSTNVVKSMKIESEIGDNSDHGAVLRNVSKVEKFVIEQLRNVIREELVWPGWLTLEF